MNTRVLALEKDSVQLKAMNALSTRVSDLEKGNAELKATNARIRAELDQIKVSLLIFMPVFMSCINAFD
jgi:hypothetical protein